MTGIAATIRGQLWWTTERVVADLQVERKTLNQWVSRSKRAGHVDQAAASHCPACRSSSVRFPHLDPPVRASGEHWYQVEQVMAVERMTRAGDLGGRIRDEL